MLLALLLLAAPETFTPEELAHDDTYDGDYAVIVDPGGTPRDMVKMILKL